MHPTPRYIVRRSDGATAARLYELAGQRMVGLHVEDPDFVRRLVERGFLVPRRPPFLQAGEQGVHGGYASRPQVNWFLAPPIEDVVAALREALRAEGGYQILPEAAEPSLLRT